MVNNEKLLSDSVLIRIKQGDSAVKRVNHIKSLLLGSSSKPSSVSKVILANSDPSVQKLFAIVELAKSQLNLEKEQNKIDGFSLYQYNKLEYFVANSPIRHGAPKVGKRSKYSDLAKSENIHSSFKLKKLDSLDSSNRKRKISNLNKDLLEAGKTGDFTTTEDCPFYIPENGNIDRDGDAVSKITKRHEYYYPLITIIFSKVELEFLAHKEGWEKQTIFESK